MSPSAILGRNFRVFVNLLAIIAQSIVLTALLQVEARAGDWSPAGSMSGLRTSHTATLLQNGKVLVVGGYNYIVSENFDQPLATAEIYDPATNSWSPAASMSQPRWWHTATLLPSGKVLVAGGTSEIQPIGITNSAEIYDPVANTWTPAASMDYTHEEAVATLLPDGRVLVAGGVGFDHEYGYTSYTPGEIDVAEIYDPIQDIWVGASSMVRTQAGAVATVLDNGRVLLAGDEVASAATQAFDPSTLGWVSTGSLNTGRQSPTATLLKTGGVLVAGGSVDGSFTGLNSAELYNPSTNGWTSLPPMNAGRLWHTASLLPSRRVLVAGGNNSTGPSAEYYDPVANQWVATDPMITPRCCATATVLQSGQVLVAGGGVAPAELYTEPSTLPPATLAASILPGGRSVEMGTPATVFATMLNSSGNPASGCQIGLGAGAPAALSLSYQTTNPVNNGLTGTPGTPASIPAGAAQSFLLSLDAGSPLTVSGQPLDFFCTNAAAAPVTLGVNTIDLAFSATPVADIVVLAATATNDGTVHVPSGGTGAFAVATVNLGAAGNLTASADTGSASLPVSVTLCQTNSGTGQCMAIPASAVPVMVAANATPTFSVFVTATGTVAFAPGTSRIFIRFKDAAGNSHGSTSVAVLTQ